MSRYAVCCALFSRSALVIVDGQASKRRCHAPNLWCTPGSVGRVGMLLISWAKEWTEVTTKEATSDGKDWQSVSFWNPQKSGRQVCM